AKLEVEQDGKKTASERISISKGRAQRVAFSAKGDKPTAITVRLVPDDFDSLASDNVAFLDLPVARPLWVYAPPSMSAYRHALQVHSEIHPLADEGKERRSESYDLVITDRVEDLGVDGRTCFYVGLIPDDLKKLVTVTKEGSNV